MTWQPPADRDAIRAELHRPRHVSDAGQALIADAVVVDMINPYVDDIVEKGVLLRARRAGFGYVSVTVGLDEFTPQQTNRIRAGDRHALLSITAKARYHEKAECNHGTIDSMLGAGVWTVPFARLHGLNQSRGQWHSGQSAST